MSGDGVTRTTGGTHSPSEKWSQNAKIMPGALLIINS